MDLRKIKKLIELLEDSALMEMEITEGENTIRLSRSGSSGPQMMGSVQPAMMMSAPAAQAPAPAEVASSADAAAKPAEAKGEVFKSPMVGTFYESSDPDSAPYVSVGSTVKTGDTLAIIEAMKTFNQLEADMSGTIRAIYKQSGEPVEYGEPLFLIEP